MAQDTWLNVVADKAAASKTDGYHSHSVSGGASASGDLTLSYDSAVVTNLRTLDTLLRTVRQRAIAGGLK